MSASSDVYEDPYDIGAELIAAGDDAPDPEGPMFEGPEDALGADRIARRRAAAMAELAEVDAQYETLRAQLDAWRSDRRKGPEYVVAEANRTLQDWARANGQKSQVKLPHATIGTRKGSARIEIDEAEFVPWATENAPDMVTVVPEHKVPAAKATIKKLTGDLPKTFGEKADTQPAVTADGEKIPGATWITDGRTYEVK